MVVTSTERKQDTRLALFAAAEDLFLAGGYGATSHADIAFAAGIGRTTFYEYFPSKEALLVELVEEELPTLTSELLAGLARDMPADLQLADLARGMIEYVAADHTLGLLLHREIPRLSDAAQDRIAAAHTDLAKEFGRLYRQGVEEGRLRALPHGLAGTFIQETIMGAARTLMAEDNPRSKIDAVAGAAVTFMLEGLSSR